MLRKPRMFFKYTISALLLQSNKIVRSKTYYEASDSNGLIQKLINSNFRYSLRIKILRIKTLNFTIESFKIKLIIIKRDRENHRSIIRSKHE